MTGPEADGSLLCPVTEADGSGCGEPMMLTYQTALELSLGDIDTDYPDPVPPGDCSAMTWKAECVAGHCLLVPEKIVSHDCSADPDCPLDHSEELRLFGARDVARLARLFGKGGAS